MAGVLRGVATVTARDVWTVGTAYGKTHDTSLILRWNGRRWKRLPGPGTGLSGVAAISAGSAWAVGSASGKTLILQWNGSTWRQVPSPTPSGGGSLSAVAAISARSAWAVGSLAPTSRGTLILRWNGTAWKRVASPRFPPSTTTGALDGVAAVSARNAWAVGSASPGVDPYSARTIALHWNGASWKRVASASRPAGGSYLSGVTATSAGSAWAVGVNMYEASPPDPDRYHLMIEHWNGAAWRLTRTSLPAFSFLSAVAGTSARNVWAVGSTRSTKTLILHWNGRSWN
jgi:hypothetical protein